MAFAACIHNVKYFAPIAASRLYEQRKVFQQINKRASSAKNIDRTNSLWNDGYKTVETYAAAAAAQAQAQQPWQQQAYKTSWQPKWQAPSAQNQQSPTQTQQPLFKIQKDKKELQ